MTSGAKLYGFQSFGRKLDSEMKILQSTVYLLNSEDEKHFLFTNLSVLRNSIKH